MPVIYTRCGLQVRFSPEDDGLVRSRPWWIQRTSSGGRFYAYTYLFSDDPNTGKRRRTKLYLHRAITQCPDGYLVDHADRNGLNNCRWNLRITTGTFNNANIEPVYGVVGYRGVTKDRKKFRARIQFGYEELHLGQFDTAREAAMAYDAKARELFGEFAWCNFDPQRRARMDNEQQLERDLEEIPF